MNVTKEVLAILGSCLKHKKCYFVSGKISNITEQYRNNIAAHIAVLPIQY